MLDKALVEAKSTRMFQFCEAYISPRQEKHDDITLTQWQEINKRYTKKSARGPDGFSRRDLQWMPEIFQEDLVDQLNSWERNGTFPSQLLTGFVYPLPKKHEANQVGDFRPVIIFSMIYRSMEFIAIQATFKETEALRWSTSIWLCPRM